MHTTRRPVTGACTVLFFAVMSGIALSSPAHAASYCHTNNRNTFGVDKAVLFDGGRGDLQYPAILHGKKVYLASNSANASAKAYAEGLAPGDILSIDRANFDVRNVPKNCNNPYKNVICGPGHYWLSTTYVQQHGTWDYCETFNRDQYNNMETPRIDGAHHAVRVCLRHNGGLQCTNVWYADNDDDATDRF